MQYLTQIHGNNYMVSQHKQLAACKGGGVFLLQKTFKIKKTTSTPSYAPAVNHTITHKGQTAGLLYAVTIQMCYAIKYDTFVHLAVLHNIRENENLPPVMKERCRQSFRQMGVISVNK